LCKNWMCWFGLVNPGGHQRRWPGWGCGLGMQRHVRPVDRDVEAGLLKLLFHVDLARRLQWQQIGTHPRNFRWGEPLLRDIHGLAGQMRRSDITLCWRGVPVDMQQMALVRDGPHRRVDLQRRMESLVVDASEIPQETAGPGAAVAPV